MVEEKADSEAFSENKALLSGSPSIGAALYFAGFDYPTSGTPGNIDMIVEAIVKNTGDEDLSNLGLTAHLSSLVWLGPVFKEVVVAPEIVAEGAHGSATTATVEPTPNPDFNGDDEIDMISGGLLEPGQSYVLRFHIEIDPDAPGALPIPKVQATASGEASGGTSVSDVSDAGYNPEGSNPGWPGDSGSSDDPTQFANSWQCLNNGIACNDLVQVSLDQTCIAKLKPETVLEGSCPNTTGEYLFPLGGYYRVAQVKQPNGAIIPDLDPATLDIYEISGAYAGLTLEVKVKDIIFENSCWGYIKLKDKLPPIINCPTEPVQSFCDENQSLIPAPEVSDNCDPSPTLTLTGQQIIDNNICDDGIYLLRRWYRAEDQYGNKSDYCIFDIQVTRPPIKFPKDITWDCETYAGFPNIVEPNSLHPLVVDTDLSDDDIDAGQGLPDTVYANTGSGIVNVAPSLCAYQVLASDQLINTCGVGFKIIRTWVVINWCNSEFITEGSEGEDNVQMVMVVDNTKPTISIDPFEVAVNIPGQHPQGCKSTGVLLGPAVSDNCNDFTVTIMTPAGEANYLSGGGINGGLIPAPGLPIGVHIVTYTATDACNNQISIPVEVTVVDNTTPTVVCDGLTAVSLTTNGKAKVFAETFDDGSNDNCCLDYFEVRRMTDNCDDGHDDKVFGPYINFCCADLGASPVTVVLRAYDCYGNHNDCMVDVGVSDNLNPELMSCPPDKYITCDYFSENLLSALEANTGDQEAQSELLDPEFGQPVFFDNCGLSVQKTFSKNIDNCLSGLLTRSWKATDSGGNSSGLCTQKVFVYHVSDWVVEFPPDVTIECEQSLPDFGEPKIFNATCELIATSHTDEIFTVVPDACYKIVRTWTVINWCVVGANVDQEVLELSEAQLYNQGVTTVADRDINGDGYFNAQEVNDNKSHRTFRDSWNNIPGKKHKPVAADALPSASNTDPDTDPDSDPWDGYIIYNQTIKVVDHEAPVFAAGCEIDEVLILDTSCKATVVLPKPTVDDCGNPNVTISAQIKIGDDWYNGFGPYLNVEPGAYEVKYNAKDNCNNQTDCYATVTVKDGKKPIVYCKDLVAELMAGTPPMVPVSAWMLNHNSWDNCSSSLYFSFSPDIADSVKLFYCEDIGADSIEIYTTDEAGNQDVCIPQLIIQDNMHTCTGSLVVDISGLIENENGALIAGVSVNMSGQASGSATTNGTGSYQFSNVPAGSDVSIVPTKDNNYLNGVTTFDMVLISKHILNVELLDSPYRLIAADVNNSKSITTFDLVEIRKMVLLISSKFENNTSWRFVDKDFVFPNPANPWATTFPEIININNISGNVVDADFVAIKIGDVNGSASFGGEAAGRNLKGDFVLETRDRWLEPGSSEQVEFRPKGELASGFQFTLNFDPQKVELQEILPSLTDYGNFGLTKLDEGAINLSWNEHGPAWEDGVAMRLVFNVKSSCRLSDVLSLDSRFVAAEAYSSEGEMLGVGLQFSDRKPVGSFELYQNKPNPFSSETVIGFYLSQTCSATLTISDAAGRIIGRWENDYAAGYHEIPFHRQELPATGVLNYRLDTPLGSATRRMVLLK